MLISNYFPANKKFIKMIEVADAYEAAVKADASDGHPVVVVRYDFECTSLELLGTIRDAIRTKHPDLLARTISMVITHEYGALLPMKYLPSTQVGVLGGTWKDGEQVSTESSSERIKVNQFVGGFTKSLLARTLPGCSISVLSGRQPATFYLC